MTLIDLPLSPETLPPPHVERLNNALVLPMEPGPDCVSGVVRADGSFRQMSRTLLSGSQLSGIPDLSPPADTDRMDGTWLFIGLGRHHFGHFLVETLIRFWALRAYREELDGIVIVPKHGMDFAVAMHRRYEPFLDLLSEELPVHLVTHPTRYQTILLPSPGFGPLGWVSGTPIFRQEIRARVGENIQPDGGRKLYVSRAQLRKTNKRVYAEDQLEQLMERAGYDVIYPEQLSIKQQLARYRAADTIVGGDGSAFHLVPFAMPKGGRVGLIQRRHRPKVFDAFVTQCQSFMEADVSTIHPVLPKTEDTPHPSEAATPISFEQAADELSAAGLI